MSFYQIHLPEGHAIHLTHMTRRGWCTSLESSMPPSAEEEEEEEFWDVS
jgi:hypothetical protein